MSNCSTCDHLAQAIEDFREALARKGLTESQRSTLKRGLEDAINDQAEHRADHN